MCDNCGCDDVKDKSLYLPEVAVLKQKKEMTNVDTFFEFELKNRPLGHKPGQFAEISIPGIGEAPISISSPQRGGNTFEMVIRNVGGVTNAIHNLKVGESAGIRGPFGTSFPMNNLKGKKLLFITGGIGLVPARSGIQYAYENRNDYKDLTVLFGCKDPSQRLFVDELKEWKASDKINFLETVDEKGGMDWDGNVGVITTLLPKLENVTPEDTYAVIVGPPIMYKFVIQVLKDMNFADDHIIMSLERRMKCGVGKCGHCQMNGKYVCQDGPVFYYSDVKDLKEAI